MLDALRRTWDAARAPLEVSVLAAWLGAAALPLAAAADAGGRRPHLDRAAGRRGAARGVRAARPAGAAAGPGAVRAPRGPARARPGMEPRCDRARAGVARRAGRSLQNVDPDRRFVRLVLDDLVDERSAG